MPPELFVKLRAVVMQDDEVANRFEAAAHQAVVFIRQSWLEVPIGKELYQSADADFDEMQARGFEWLEKPAGESECDAILQPRLGSPSGRELDQSRRCQCLAVEIGDQSLSRLILGGERVAEHVTIADAVLKRDAPLPAGLAGSRACIRRERSAGRARHGKGAVARQPVRPVLIFGVQRAVDQKPGEAGAVDEQIPADGSSVAEY